MKIFPESWGLKPLNEVCNEVVDCINKTAPVVDYPTDFKMIRTTNVRNGRIDLGTAKFVVESTFKKWTRRLKPKRNDVVLTREAPLGEIGLMRTDEKAFLGQRTMAYRANPRSLNQIFLYYSFQGYTLQSQIKSLGSGATVEHLRVPDAEKLKIPLPPPPIQKKIAAILSAYDELIENNNRRIAILEKMAEGIYREWFVRMRFPGHEKVKVVKGAPEGWKVTRLEQFCERVTDGTHDTPKPTLHGFFLITGKNLKDGTIDFEGAYKISENDHINISKRSGLESGDILFSNIGTLGSIAIVTDEIEYSVKNIIIFRPRNNEQSLFLYYLLKEKYVFDQFLLYSSGASQQFISLGTARGFRVFDPGQDLISEFGKMVQPLIQQKMILQSLNTKHKQSRDLLLPRLISGKLDVDKLDITFPPGMRNSGPTEGKEADAA